MTLKGQTPKGHTLNTHLWQTDFSSSHKSTTSWRGENSSPREIEVRDIYFLLMKSLWQNKDLPGEPESIRLAYTVWVREGSNTDDCFSRGTMLGLPQLTFPYLHAQLWGPHPSRAILWPKPRSLMQLGQNCTQMFGRNDWNIQGPSTCPPSMSRIKKHSFGV